MQVKSVVWERNVPWVLTLLQCAAQRLTHFYCAHRSERRMKQTVPMEGGAKERSRVQTNTNGTCILCFDRSTTSPRVIPSKALFDAASARNSDHACSRNSQCLAQVHDLENLVHSCRACDLAASSQYRIDCSDFLSLCLLKQF